MTDDDRPDPDALLREVEQQEQQALRGRLKIFFGASPGVGKTYAMPGCRATAARSSAAASAARPWPSRRVPCSNRSADIRAARRGRAGA